MEKTVEQLKADIEALEAEGLNHAEEDAQLKQLILAGGGKAPAKAKAPAPAGAEGDFVPLNIDSYETGGGGGWVAPESTGVKDAICKGYMVPDFVDDQLWFIFENPEYPDGDDPFRGSLVCAAVTRGEKSGAWKVRDVTIALGIESAVKIVEGKGISGLKACEGKLCQVLWEDIPIKGKTERRIQDVMAPGAEAAM